DSQKDAKTSLANAKSGKTDGTTETATTDGGSSVGVAAALALNVSNSVADVSVDNVAINGDLTLAASNNMDAKAEADGSASVGDGAGVGVAVAINVADMDNLAVLGSGATVNGGFTASATMKDVGGDTSHDFAALATSGASASDVGVAGSFGLNIVDSDTVAALEGAVNAGAEAVSLTAASTSASDVEGKANASGNTGVGASFAINVVDSLSRAEVADGAVLSGGSDLTLSATGSHDATTTATAGGEAPDGTGVGGAIAISVIDSLTEARVGTGGDLMLSGAFSASAAHHGATTTTADGTALGADAAIGAAIALGFVDDIAESDLDRNASAASVSLTAAADGASTVTAKASATGEDSGAASDSDSQKDAKTSLANAKSGKTDGATETATTDGGSSVGVAAALALNVSNSVADASVDNVAINGDLTLAASNNMDAKAEADGSQADG
ncbi:MAG: hypothetical protein GY837_19585, partial [Bosea sp.]|uniref:hypothetical protein n=1 Tax=Bosea sp. (in: a-proteobacteria) TaxID=1871050 RepID=UPI0031FEB091|nr:hypothetical protein [Bosea sp. (in: a-proteobacteria)]